MFFRRKKLNKLLIILTLLVINLSTGVFAENFGIVDLQRVFVGYNETDKARKDFEKKQKELRDEIEKASKKQ